MSRMGRAIWARLFDASGWWMTASLTLLAAALRLPGLGRVREFSFDETYYAKDAFSLLKFGYERAFVSDANSMLLAGNENVFKATSEFIVHPSLGKWAIAIGEWTFGMNPFGWRIVMAVIGIVAVAIVHRTAQRLIGNDYTAAVAGLFMAIDGLAIVMSRTALLDQTLMFFVLCTFYALVRDRDDYAHTLAMHGYVEVPRWRALRPWRLVAIACITAAMATKWSALWFAIAFALLALWWDASARRRHEVPARWLGDIAWLAVAVITGLAGYLLSWIGWFRSTDGWGRTWTEGPQWLPQALRALLHYHQQALDFHVHLTSPHPYKAVPYWWPLMVRPTSFTYNSYSNGKNGCTTTSCSAEVLALGNIAIWWVGSIVIVALLAIAVVRLFRRGSDSRVRWDVVSGPLVCVAAGWLPWLYWHDRTTFSFYSIVFAPYLFMLAAYGLSLFATQRVTISVPAPQDEFDATEDAPGTVELVTEALHRRRFIAAAAVVVVAVAFTAFFYPIWTGIVMPYSAWQLRMWLPSWV